MVPKSLSAPAVAIVVMVPLDEILRTAPNQKSTTYRFFWLSTTTSTGAGTALWVAGTLSGGKLS